MVIRVDSYQPMDQYWDLLDSMDHMVEYINDHGVFYDFWLVYAWSDQRLSFFCGNTNPQTSNPDSQFDSGVICYHPS